MTAWSDRAKNQSTKSACSPAENTLQIKAPLHNFASYSQPNKQNCCLPPFEMKAPISIIAAMSWKWWYPDLLRIDFGETDIFWSNGHLISPTLVPWACHHHTRVHLDVDSLHLGPLRHSFTHLSTLRCMCMWAWVHLQSLRCGTQLSWLGQHVLNESAYMLVEWSDYALWCLWNNMHKVVMYLWVLWLVPFSFTFLVCI